MKNKAFMFAGIAILIWGFNSAISKLLLNDLTPMQLIFAGSLGGCLTMLVILLKSGKIQKIRTLSPKSFLQITGIGAFGNFFYYLLFYTGMSHLPAQQAYLINYMWPVATILLAALILKERITAVSVAAFTCSLIGVICVAFQGKFEPGKLDLAGILLCLGGSVSYGVYNNLIKKYPFDLEISNFIHALTATIVSLVILIVTGSLPRFNTAFFSSFLIYGTLNLGIAYLLWGHAIRGGNTSAISNLGYLTPVVSLIFIATIVGEKIAPWSIAGLIFILLSVVIQSIFPLKKKG